MNTKILCATDGSYASEKAVDYAVSLATLLTSGGADTRLTFLTVSSVPEGKPIRGIQVLRDAVDEQIFLELHSARVKALKAGLKNTTCVQAYGHNIAAVIIDYADKEGYTHIITGSTGRTGVIRLLLGSVATDVVAKAHCPVTVVR